MFNHRKAASPGDTGGLNLQLLQNWIFTGLIGESPVAGM